MVCHVRFGGFAFSRSCGVGQQFFDRQCSATDRAELPLARKISGAGPKKIPRRTARVHRAPIAQLRGRVRLRVFADSDRGRRCDRGRKPVRLVVHGVASPSHDVVALAGRCLEAGSIDNSDPPTSVLDEAMLLKPARQKRNGGAARAKLEQLVTVSNRS